MTMETHSRPADVASTSAWLGPPRRFIAILIFFTEAAEGIAHGAIWFHWDTVMSPMLFSIMPD